MRLTGEDARRWLEQNPNASFIDNRTGQRIDAQQGGFMKFLQGITKPVRTFIPAAQEFGRTIGDIGRFARGEELSQAPETYFGMTREESEQFAKDPLQRGVKAGVALGAYGVPMGGGQAASALGRVGTAAGRGAISGTMSGFGYSEEGQEAQGALSGGALGGILGGALQGVGEVGRAIRKGGANLRSSGEQKLKTLELEDARLLEDKSLLLDEIESQMGLLGSQGSDVLPVSPTMARKMGLSPQELTNIKGELLVDMSRRGFAVDSAENIANSLKPYRVALSKEKAEILASLGSRQMVGTGEITKSLKRFNSIMGENKTTTRLLNDEISNILGKGYSINKLPKRMTTSQVVQLKEVVDNIAGGFDKIMAADSSSVASGQLLKDIREASRGVLTGNSALDDVLVKMSNTYKLEGAVLEAPLLSQRLAEKSTSQASRLGILRAKELTKMSDVQRGIEDSRQVGLKLPLTDSSIPVPINPRAIGPSVAFTTGRVLEKMPDTSFIPRLTQRAVPGIVGATQGMQQGQPQQQVEGLGGMLPQQQAPQIDQMALINAVMNGQISTTEANWLMEMLGGGAQEEEKLSKDQANAKAALQSLDTMESILQSDSGALAKTYLPFQGFNENAQVLEQAALNIEDIIARMRTGAVINDEEAARYRKMIPRITDTAGTKAQKLSQLRQIFGSIYQEQAESNDSSALYQMLGLQ